MSDPQKPPYFYLSYARAEDKTKVQQFFNDVSDSIRIRAGLPLTEIVGCCDPFEENANDREAGLRTSHLMIALLSFAYFKDKTAGREWQIFETRKEKSGSADARVIIPISWLPYSGPMPRIIRKTRIFDANGGETHEPVASMLRSGEKRKDYADFVTGLANYIVDFTASFRLPEMESIPNEVANAFEIGDETLTNTQPTKHMTKKILNQNLLIIDGAFAKSVVEQLKEIPDTPAPSSTTSVSSGTGQSKRTTNETYSVFVIDDEPLYVQRIEATGDLSREFAVTAYTDPDQLLDDVTALLKERREPDLVVLNPERLLPRKGGNLMGALLDIKVPSAILAISQNPDTARSLESIGIDDLVGILQKPFTSFDFLPFMRRWAEFGRDKRYRRGRSEKRPAFLSYTGPDENMASRICKWLELREIGVWYSFTTLKAGDPWKDKVAEGLVEAEVFMPLISDDYALSPYCHSEMGIALDRLQREAGNLLVVPLLYNSPNAALQDSQIKRCRNQQVIEISDDEWLEGVKELLHTVKGFLNRDHSSQS